MDRRALVYVISPEVELANDSFWFRLTDPAGNSAWPDRCVRFGVAGIVCVLTPRPFLPRRLDLSWSRVQLSATCYRTCESAAELLIQVERSGRSADPAFVAIQVGSAPPPRPPR